MAKSIKMKYEEAIRELESIVVQLESNKLSLDESLQIFERGIFLTEYCSQKLNEAEGKISILVKGNHEYEEQPFNVKEEGSDDDSGKDQ